MPGSAKLRLGELGRLGRGIRLLNWVSPLGREIIVGITEYPSPFDLLRGW